MGSCWAQVTARATGQRHTREGDDARPLSVEPHVLGVALHCDHLDARHGGEGAGARSVRIEVAGRETLRTQVIAVVRVRVVRCVRLVCVRVVRHREGV